MRYNKIRLYRGPFDGKVLDHRDAGRNEIVLRGTKPMTRKQKYEFQRDLYASTAYNPYQPLDHQLPIVTARYRIVMMFANGVSVPCQHPDGSLFYEWDQPRRKK